MSLTNRGQYGENKLITLMPWLEWAFLLAGLWLITITEVYRSSVLIGLLLLGIALIVRIIRSGHIVPNTGLEVPWILFIGSAALAAAISYRPQLAFLQFSRILAAVIIFYAVCDSPLYHQRLIAICFVIAAVVLAIYWPLQHDFSLEPVKFSPINNLGLWINNHLPNPKIPSITGPAIHPNVAASTLLLALPFAFALIWQNRHPAKKIWLFLSILSVVLILDILLLTTSRGAWLALTATVFLAVLSWIQRRWFLNDRAKVGFWSAVLILVIWLIVALQVTDYYNQLLGQIPDASGSLQTRPQMWREGLGLVRDYFYTGSGLMTTMMVYSTYARLIEVPFIFHIHNLFLEVWIEQGILGVIGLIWVGILIAWWAWKALSQRQVAIWGWAGIASLTTVAVHGIFDVVFYVGRTLPLIGLVFGYTCLIKSPSTSSESITIFSKQRKWLYIGLGACFLVGILIFHRLLISTWYANVGAFTQTYLEESRYDPSHPDNPTMDQVRRTLDLRVAEAEFNKAISWQPENLTAHQRLAEIAMSRGEYATALDLMRPAWENGHTDEVTRLLYGDALVADGKPEQAAAIINNISSAILRLKVQAWYRYSLNNDYQRAAYALETILYLDPNNQEAVQSLVQVKEKLHP